MAKAISAIISNEDYLWDFDPRKGGDTMKKKLSIALNDLSKIAKALTIVSKAGLDVLSLIK